MRGILDIISMCGKGGKEYGRAKRGRPQGDPTERREGEPLAPAAGAEAAL